MTQRVLFAGGGSGGHLSPALAIAETLADGSPPVDCHFACSDRRVDAHMLAAAGARAWPLPALPPALRPDRLARFVLHHRRAVARCRTVLEENAIDHVVALGGFVSVPAVTAAVQRGTGTTLLNLDAVPGRANRWLGRRVDRIWSTIPTPTWRRRPDRLVPFPVRRAAIAPGPATACRERLGLEPQRRTLLVTGASQGAESINRLVPALCAQAPAAFGAWQILHLAGPDRDDTVRTAYDRAGVRCVVLPFLDEMGLAWGAADAAISRAGANSVAEAAVNRVPTLFLPYPFHRDLHQRHNAEPLVARGAALLAHDLVDVDRNLISVGPLVRDLLHDEGRRDEMRTTLDDLEGSGTEIIAALLRELAGV